MPIMSAGMHAPRMEAEEPFAIRAVLLIASFFHFIAVHIKTQRYSLAGTSRMQDADDAGLATGHGSHEIFISTFFHGPLHAGSQYLLVRQSHLLAAIDDFLAKVNLITKSFQLMDDHASRPELRPASLGMTMQIPAALDHFRIQMLRHILYFLIDIHIYSLFSFHRFGI